MTAEEFEIAVSELSSSVGPFQDMLEYLDYLQRLRYHNSRRQIQNRLKMLLDKVEPIEDRVPLLLKYSDYLN